MLWNLLGENRQRYELRNPQGGKPAGTPCWVHRTHGGLTLVLDFDDGTYTSLDGRTHRADGLERPHWTEWALSLARIALGRETPQDQHIAGVVARIAMYQTHVQATLDDPEFENRMAVQEVLDE